jgi:chromate transporter
MACYFGFLSRGRIGSVLAGLSFLMPGFLIMLTLAWLYDSFYVSADNKESSQYILASFSAIQCCVAAMVFRAVHRMGISAMQDSDGQLSIPLLVLSLLAALQNVLNVNFFITLAVGGLCFVRIVHYVGFDVLLLA